MYYTQSDHQCAIYRIYIYMCRTCAFTCASTYTVHTHISHDIPYIYTLYEYTYAPAYT